MVNILLDSGFQDMVSINPTHDSYLLPTDLLGYDRMVRQSGNENPTILPRLTQEGLPCIDKILVEFQISEKVEERSCIRRVIRTQSFWFNIVVGFRNVKEAIFIHASEVNILRNIGLKLQKDSGNIIIVMFG